ncbi:MAG: arsenite efflux MFS transporter ArsK [Devosia sp.]|uniref:arsenite efflux MFS transporter ArsK n=1 Tax=Devosia sp. 66-22 TaxID=1895753 RepID=UPI0009270C81|nr:arsenite efflux MFS transporter ArsK [Devosia sp. 66-22]MBN9345490.1 arsenite efflux MFS transporter ArsK [Devosia sp.]OJX47830.1 MAG: MFS transporter [Devosia sp. 66-22]
MSRPVPAAAIWALGATQIVGYGTLYYSFSVLAPSFGETFGWSQEWVYAALSLSLLAGGIAAPIAGGLVDRFGAGRVMTIGSVLAALGFVVAAFAQNGVWFAAALIAMEVISSLVLYATAFAALVRIGGKEAQRSITHLTLIAGFASTLFWPLTAGLIQVMDWRGVYLVFAALNLFLCAPLHWWVGTLEGPDEVTPAATVEAEPAKSRSGISLIFLLMMAGFAIEGFILSAVLNHIAPLLTMLGLAGPSILITTLFGPAQVLSRFVNMLFGKGLRQTHLTIIAAALPGLGVLALALGGPSALAGMVFALLFGLGSGLTSIVSGSLPLELFGRHRYGSRLGWLSSARQIASAVAPFGLAVAIGKMGIVPALFMVVAMATAATCVFALIAGREADTRDAGNNVAIG